MENRQASNNNLGNGFLLGVIVGTIVTLLFTTKKGRQILHKLTEEGKDKVSELQDKIYEVKQGISEDIENAFVEDDVIESEKNSIIEKEQEEPNKKEKEETSKKPSGAVKKFFSKKG